VKFLFQNDNDRQKLLNDSLEVVRIERVLTNDPGIGIARHADAGYPLAQKEARAKGIKIPMRK
jgi:urocanate hydratase